MKVEKIGWWGGGIQGKVLGQRLRKVTCGLLKLVHTASLASYSPASAWCQVLALAGVSPEEEVSEEALKCFPGA